MEAVSLSHKDGFATIFRLEGVLSVCLSMEDAGHYLRRHIQSVVASRLFLDEIVHEKAFEHIDEEHFGLARPQMKLLANALQGKRNGWVLLEKVDYNPL